jgi:hypothetical protein
VLKLEHGLYVGIACGKGVLDKTLLTTNPAIPAEVKRRAGTPVDFAAQGLGLGFAVRDDTALLLHPTPIAPRGNHRGCTLVRGRGAWCAPDEVGQINGLARNTTQTVRPG